MFGMPFRPMQTHHAIAALPDVKAGIMNLMPSSRKVHKKLFWNNFEFRAPYRNPGTALVLLRFWGS